MGRTIKTSVILIFLLMCIYCLPASAGSISGSVSGSVTFYVRTGPDAAWICLESVPGMAETRRDDSDQTVPDRRHGYYYVSGSWADSENTEQLIWAPSASDHQGMIYESDPLFIRFSRCGVCAVTIEPMNAADIEAYLSGDVFVCWDSDASWSVSGTSGCSVLTEKPSGKISIRCVTEDGTVLDMYEEIISSSRVVYAKEIPGYICPENSIEAEYDMLTCESILSEFSFIYVKETEPESGSPVSNSETDTAGSGTGSGPEEDTAGVPVPQESISSGEKTQHAALSNVERQAIAKQIGDHALGQQAYALSSGNIREQPDSKSPYVGKLSAGRSYEILDVAVAFQTDNIWYKVEYADNRFGWVAAFAFATEDLSY